MMGAQKIMNEAQRGLSKLSKLSEQEVTGQRLPRAHSFGTLQTFEDFLMYDVKGN